MPLVTHPTMRVLALLGAVRNMKHKLNLFFAFKGLIVIVVEGKDTCNTEYFIAEQVVLRKHLCNSEK